MSPTGALLTICCSLSLSIVTRLCWKLLEVGDKYCSGYGRSLLLLGIASDELRPRLKYFRKRGLIVERELATMPACISTLEAVSILKKVKLYC